MICYRDRTFCEACCGTRSCPRMLTDEVRAAARRWWGSDDPPITVADLHQTCSAWTPPSEETPEGSFRCSVCSPLTPEGSR